MKTDGTENKQRRFTALCHRGSFIISVMVLLGGCAATIPKSDAPNLGRLEAKQDPDLSAQLAELGQQALKGGDFKNAFVHFSRAIEAQPDNAAALLGLGESYLGVNNLPKASASFEKAEQFEGSKAFALQGRGIALARMGQRERAQTTLLDAVGRDPNLWRAWNALGAGYDVARNWKSAIAAYRKALEIAPKAPELHNNMGVSLLLQKRYQEALAVFDIALDIAPGMKNTHENRRLALAYQGYYLDATANVPHGDRAKVLNNVGYAAMQNGDYSIAEGYFAEAMQASASYYQKASENLEEVRYRRALKARKTQVK